MGELELSRQGAVALLRLGGRLDERLLMALVDRLDALADDGVTRAAVLVMGGGRPSAGGAVEDGPAPGPAGHPLPRAGAGLTPSAIRATPLAIEDVERVSGLFQRTADGRLPVVAAVADEALDEGLTLALCCDIRLAAGGARFGAPAAQEGWLPLGGLAARLARAVGRAMAARVLLLGDTLDAEEALACGLVSRVVAPAELEREALRLAGVIAARGPLAVRYAKEALRRGLEMPLDQALRYETDLTVILQTTADRAEGVRAFVEKRPPQFRGE